MEAAEDKSALLAAPEIHPHIPELEACLRVDYYFFFPMDKSRIVEEELLWAWVLPSFLLVLLLISRF